MILPILLKPDVCSLKPQSAAGRRGIGDPGRLLTILRILIIIILVRRGCKKLRDPYHTAVSKVMTPTIPVGPGLKRQRKEGR